jgi:hypothetical protein
MRYFIFRNPQVEAFLARPPATAFSFLALVKANPGGKLSQFFICLKMKACFIKLN